MNDPAKTKSETEETAKSETAVTETDPFAPGGEISDEDLEGISGGISVSPIRSDKHQASPSGISVSSNI